MSGRLLDAVRIVPPALWPHLGARFHVAAPDLASLPVMYGRAPPLMHTQRAVLSGLPLALLPPDRHRPVADDVRRPASRAQLVRKRLIDGVRPVRSPAAETAHDPAGVRSGCPRSDALGRR
jgi:hypothetical protein